MAQKMAQKEWLKAELTGEAVGQLSAMFATTIALLTARVTWLKKKKAPAGNIIELALDDMKQWRDELQLTEDDEV